jgi:hypothetical protein
MRKLGDWLKAYLQYNQYSEAPDMVHFWTGISCISAVLKQKVYIDQVKFQWIPNFYIVIVAPPWIATKSTSIRTGEELVAELGTIKIGPDSLTWQSLPKLLEDCQEQHMMPNGDSLTISPMAFFASEFESMINFEDHQMMVLLTDLWDGKKRPWQRVTKTQGSSTIFSPYISIIACTTPSGISGLPKKALRGGFASRIIFVETHTKKQLVPYPSKVIPPVWHKDLHDVLLRDLEAIACLKGPFVIEDDAMAWGDIWYQQMYKDYLALNTEEEQAMMGRKQTQLHKLAMVLSAAKGDSMTITITDLQAADILLRSVQKDAASAVRTVTTTQHMDATVQMADIIKKNGRMLKTELYSKYFFHRMTARDFKDALQALVDADIAIEISTGPRIYVEAIVNGSTP